MAGFMYILKCANDTFYVGSTKNLIRRFKEHQKHEQRYVGKYFKAKPTRLQLNYRCSDDAKEKMVDTLMKIHNSEETLDFFFFRINFLNI